MAAAAGVAAGAREWTRARYEGGMEGGSMRVEREGGSGER